MIQEPLARHSLVFGNGDSCNADWALDPPIGNVLPGVKTITTAPGAKGLGVLPLQPIFRHFFQFNKSRTLKQVGEISLNDLLLPLPHQVEAKLYFPYLKFRHFRHILP
jgi:hypothetical protein